MKIRTLSIGIAGCGIGGMATALFLSRAGHIVTVFDRFETPSSIGSGLVIQPVGMAVLEALGLAARVQSQGQKIFKMSGIESETKRRVLNVDYGHQGGERNGLGIHRASLFDTLYQALIEDRNIKLKCGHSIQDCPQIHEKRVLVDSTGVHFGPFDLVIDASGARSKLSPITTRDLPYGALWGTVNWPHESALPQDRLSQCYRDARNMLGVLPLGTVPNDKIKKAAIFWSEPRTSLLNWPQTNLESWKAKTVSLWPEFAVFVEQIKEYSDLTSALYQHGTLRTPYQEHIAYIGDAAHQASPQLGQGANMALLDAQALYHAITKHADIHTALKAYAKKRHRHVQLYQTFSAVFTPFYQSNSRVLPLLRNNVMNPLSGIWPVKPMLTRLVCGTLIKP